MTKALFLVVLIHLGHEHVDPVPVTLEHCVANIMEQRRVKLLIQKKHPDFNPTFECRPQRR